LQKGARWRLTRRVSACCIGGAFVGESKETGG
jgi:hypothetical protein